MIIYIIDSSDFLIKWLRLRSAPEVGLYKGERKKYSFVALFPLTLKAILAGHLAKARCGKFDFVTCAIADTQIKYQ